MTSQLPHSLRIWQRTRPVMLAAKQESKLSLFFFPLHFRKKRRLGMYSDAMEAMFEAKVKC